MTTIASLLRELEGVDRPGLVFEDRSWTHAEVVAASAQRAALLRSLRRDGPFHVGVLLDNVPEFPLWLGAAALAGAVVVGINPTRRGAELERDVRHTRCQLVVSDAEHLPLLDGLDIGVGGDRVLDVDGPAYADLLGAHEGAPLVDDSTPGSLYLLLFTSGTSGAPKAVKCSQGRLARAGVILRDRFGLGPDDVCYQAMPMFHSNAVFAGWTPAIAAGACSALRRRFSASGFLDDVRRFRATYFNYVGKPLAYVLATPERPADGDNPLRSVFGNEAAEQDIAEFARRFGCVVVDGYGSTEGGTSITRTDDTPPGSLGRGTPGVVVLDPDTLEERPPAVFDADGRLVNAEEAIGEIVNKDGVAGFEGYWENEEAVSARTRHGWFWTGDLGYRDADGFVYFAGRDFEWLRVDGENFAAAPVERILGRHPDVAVAAVYAVPDEDVGDQVMAAVQLRDGATFDGAGFGSFLDAQTDLGTKWAPRYVRVSPALPATASNKIRKRDLRRDAWTCADPVWWREGRAGRYRLLTADDVEAIRARFEARGRLAVLDV